MASIEYVSPSETNESYGAASFYMTSQLSPCSDRLRVPRSAQTSLETENISSKIYQGQATTSSEQDIIAEEKVEKLLSLVNVQDTTSLAAYSAAELYCASKYLKYPEEGRSLKGMDPRLLFHTKETLMEAGAKGTTVQPSPRWRGIFITTRTSMRAPYCLQQSTTR